MSKNNLFLGRGGDTGRSIAVGLPMSEIYEFRDQS